MFLGYYKLNDQPFGVTPDPGFLFLSPTHRGALASLYYRVTAGRGFVALIAQTRDAKNDVAIQVIAAFRNFFEDGVHLADVLRTVRVVPNGPFTESVSRTSEGATAQPCERSVKLIRG
jgi:hypothetical protein